MKKNFKTMHVHTRMKNAKYIYIYILTETETKKHALKAQAVSPEKKVICWYDQSYSTFIIERAL